MAKDISSLLPVKSDAQEAEISETSFEISGIIYDRINRDPKAPRVKGQEWFWTDEWQAAEREVDEWIKSGGVSPRFDNAANLIKSLRSVEPDEV